MKQTRTFGDKVYRYDSRSMTKRGADFRASILRNRGKSVRVVKVKAEYTKGRYYWAVYVR